MLWGVLSLGESVNPTMLAGAALVIGGTAAVLRPPRPAPQLGLGR